MRAWCDRSLRRVGVSHRRGQPQTANLRKQGSQPIREIGELFAAGSRVERLRSFGLDMNRRKTRAVRYLHSRSRRLLLLRGRGEYAENYAPRGHSRCFRPRVQWPLLTRLTKRVTCDIFRSGYGIRTVQELLGHADVRTTMIYAHVLNRGGHGVRSLADMLGPGLGAPGATRNPSKRVRETFLTEPCVISEKGASDCPKYYPDPLSSPSDRLARSNS